MRTLLDVHDIELPPGTGADPLGDTAPAMEPFTVMEDDRVEVTAILVPHGPVFPSFALRFDCDEGSVVFSGDTRASDNVVRLARDADILVHEVLDLEFYEQLGVPGPLLEHFKQGHTLTTEIGALAQSAGVRTLVLSHLVPSNPGLMSDAEYRRKCQVGSRDADRRQRPRPDPDPPPAAAPRGGVFNRVLSLSKDPVSLALQQAQCAYFACACPSSARFRLGAGPARR